MEMSDAKRAPRLLAAMAHPDDAEILVGGALFQLKARGWELGILTMTSGDCGSATHSREEISRIRSQEAKEAAAFLGADYQCAGMRDIEIFANADSVRRVVEGLRRFAPDVVLTHSPADYMVDHEETSRIVRSAVFTAAIPLYQTQQIAPAPPISATPALYYADPVEGIDAMGQRIRPQFFVNIEATIEQKLAMLACHRSQRDWLRAHHGMDEYLEQVRRWDARVGAECGVPAAEGFRQHLGHGYPQEPILQRALPVIDSM
jgi:LmbE family N-acetylglucosaminyl deacetylase